MKPFDGKRRWPLGLAPRNWGPRMLANMRRARGVLIVLLCVPAGCTHRANMTQCRSPAQRVEIVEEHWPDGKLRLRKHMLRGPDGTPINHGPYRRWHTDGRKEYEANFVRGEKDGIETRWHRNGQKWIEACYVRGRRHGVSHTWDEDGMKRKEERHTHGKPHGTWTVWDRDGNVKWQGRFEHDAPEP